MFALLTYAHLRMTDETKASKPILWVALIATSLAIVVFAVYTVYTDPAVFVALVATIVLAWVVEFAWQRIRARQVPSAP